MPDSVFGRDNQVPLISLPGALAGVVVALLLCWPAWLLNAVWWFPDTANYLKGGEAIWSYLSGVFAADMGPSGIAGGLVTDADGSAASARSFTSSFVIFASWKLGGDLAIAVVQTWIVVFTAFALISPETLARPAILGLGTVWLAFATSLPWAAVFLVPDILAAVPILFGIVMALRWDALGRWQALVLTLLAAYAASSHYGHVPLAAGMMVVALSVRILRRQPLGLPLLAASILVVVSGPLLHLGASARTLDSTSAAPLRLPILLARSIEDGPARWYLQDVCPEAELVLCEVLGEDIPDNVGAVLWSSKGVQRSSTEQMAAIRAEEPRVLMAAFLDYPVEQIRSLFGNAARQFVMVDVPGRPKAEIDTALKAAELPPGHRALRADAAFDELVVWGTSLGLVAAGAALLIVRPHPAHLWALGIVLAGLALNAGIFGGLSAPVGRYQSRVIWIPIFAMVVFVAEARALRQRQS